MHIFVTGGSGFVGKRLVARLTREGHHVKALSRSESSDRVLRERGAEPVRGSLEDVSSWESALQGAAAVVHTASPLATWGPWSLFERSIVDATRDLARASIRQNVRRLVYLSSESVLQDRAPLLDVDESFPPARSPNSFYGRAKKLAEGQLAGLASEIEAIVLRPTFIWGEDAPAFATVLAKVADGTFAWIDGGRAAFEAVHVDNVVEAVVDALTRGRPGEAYLIADGEASTFRAFWERVFAAHGVQAPRASVPGWVARPAAAALEATWRLVGAEKAPPLTRFEVAFAAMPRRYSIRKSRAELGFDTVVSRDEGFRRLEAQTKRVVAAIADAPAAPV
jgi:nucleoside-diphosphate-sugar epimerase